MSYYNNEKEVKSILDYLEIVLEISEKNNTELWYRGHCSQDWKLIPSLFREKVLDMPDDGFVHPIRYTNFYDFNKIIKEFRENNNSDDDFSKKLNLFHYTFLAQHYGLLTPALDWSTDPLVALYFAVDKFDESEDDFPVVYILNPSRLNSNSQIHYDEPGHPDINSPFCIDFLDDSKFDEWYSDLNNTPFSMMPFAVKTDFDLKSHRLSRQSGVFTLHEARESRGVQWFTKTDAEGNPMAIAIKICPKSVKLLKNQLHLLDITNESIYGKEKTEMEISAKKITATAKRI